MAAPLTDKAFWRLLDKRIDLWVQEGRDRVAVKYPDKFFTVKSGNKAWLEAYGIGSVPNPVAFNGLIQYQDVAPGYHTKIEPKEYAGGIIVQRLLLETDQYDAIEGLATGLGEAMDRLRNDHAVEPFAYCDSTSFTFATREEGVAIASNSHTTKAVSVSTTYGFDNLSTLAFDAVNLEALRLQAKGIRNDIGKQMPGNNFDTIIHGPSLSEAVWEVINSQGKVDTADNNENFQKSLKWKAIEVQELDDVENNCNNWGIVDSAAMKKALVWYDLIKPEFKNTEDFDTLMRKYRSYGAWGWGATDWRWVVWSVVA